MDKKIGVMGHQKVMKKSYTEAMAESEDLVLVAGIPFLGVHFSKNTMKKSILEALFSIFRYFRAPNFGILNTFFKTWAFSGC